MKKRRKAIVCLTALTMALVGIGGTAAYLTSFDRINWILKEDGYYYYRYPLKEGQSTTPLFTGFYIDFSRMDKTYLDQISEFRIQVYEESVQAAGFSDYLSAWKYYQEQI